MIFSDKFITASGKMNSFRAHVNAPLIRREFYLDAVPKCAELTITALGFYELYLNGQRLTRGLLSPGITNPDQLIYYDRYDVTPHLKKGGNCLALMLGNGMQNTDFRVWDFDKAPFRSAPKTALALELDGVLYMECDERFKWEPSPITFDDLRGGEWYDARLKKDGFSLYGYDDSDWQNCTPASTPKGDKVLSIIPPIQVTERLKPIKIYRGIGYHTFDFGVNTAGIIELKLKGIKGQKLVMQVGEVAYKGRVSQRNITFRWNVLPKYHFQAVKYISGGGAEEYTPSFTYFGGRYVTVKGLLPHQVSEDTLTFLVMNTDMKNKGGFESDSAVLNKLQEYTVRSNKANYYHFPTDCPHREKNGWTGDAALSAEQFTLNHDTRDAFVNWLRAVVHAQKENGQLPGIVPTSDWGYDWGSGPNWDNALFELPYVLYRYYGDLSAIKECSGAMVKYLSYLKSKIRANGTVEYGLGDWCQIGVKHRAFDTPVEVTDTLCCIELTRKAEFMLSLIGESCGATLARELNATLRKGFLEHLVSDDLEVNGKAQTGQAMAIHYGLFSGSDKLKAYAHLLRYVERDGSAMRIGVLGNRVLFRLLADMGDVDLALKLITQDKYPSFAHWITTGCTALKEDFTHTQNAAAPVSKKDLNSLYEFSLNHHFWGDISAFMICHLGGIRVNPNLTDPSEIVITHCIPKGLEKVRAYYDSVVGRVETIRDGRRLKVIVPKGAKVTLNYGGSSVVLREGENDIEL
ncbi:MAG: family 78 glycoside hydrolase catalytic domain [Clostridia bacterium]|nr:family 78 glycoside hydrolase catalytic domain [Clostridia bacterium]